MRTKKNKLAKQGGRRMSTKKQRLIDAEELKQEMIRVANRRRFNKGEVEISIGTIVRIIEDSPTILYRKVVKK